MADKKIILSLILTLTITSVYAEGQYGMEAFFDKMALIGVFIYTLIIGIITIIIKKVVSKKVSLKTVLLSFLSPLAVFTILYLIVDSIFFGLPYIFIKGLFE
jgi:hypothetical protein